MASKRLCVRFYSGPVGAVGLIVAGWVVRTSSVRVGSGFIQN